MSWMSLRITGEMNAQQYRRDMTERPVACPHDGEPLQPNGNILHCPWGDYTWPESQHPQNWIK